MEVDYLIIGSINAIVLPLIILTCLTTSLFFIPWGSAVGAVVMGLLLLLEYEKAISRGLLISVLICIAISAYIIVVSIINHLYYFLVTPM
jgi:hypothetical protein